MSTEWIIVIILLALVVFFAGDPDIHDIIMERWFGMEYLTQAEKMVVRCD